MELTTNKRAEIIEEILEAIAGSSGPFTVYAERLASAHYPNTVGSLFPHGGSDSPITTAEIAAEFIEKHPDAGLYIRDEHTRGCVFEQNVTVVP